MPQSSTWKSLFIICVFTTFVFGSVGAYTCTHCFNETCNSNSQSCETSQGCFSYKQEFYVSGMSSDFIQEKGCSSNKCAQLSFSATLGNERTFVYDHRCCQAEQCNKQDFQLSQKPSNPNGIECPACYTENDMFCDSVLLKCTGAETKCVEVIGTVAINGISYLSLFGMGCATETACNLRNVTVVRDTKIHTYCTGATNGTPPMMPIFSPILTSFFLLKVLL
ncbi:protein RoBo-1-like [Castor canadensis]|uniref:Protein RoBo-1-like n=1 Tax=Castor canadensis TaxID=51338 RepID=A0AC58L2U8_CASCN